MDLTSQNLSHSITEVVLLEQANQQVIHISLNKALDIAEDPETVEMDLLLLPGINNSEITNRMIEVVDERQDSLAIIDLEYAYTTSAETTPSQEGKGSLASCYLWCSLKKL